MGNDRDAAPLGASRMSTTLPEETEGSEESTLRKALKAVVISLAHILCSAMMILWNRRVLMPDRFPQPIALTTLHMISAFIFSNLLRYVRPELMPSAPLFLSVKSDSPADPDATSKMLQRLWPFVPIGLLYGSNVVSSNAALKFASVAFLQMIKESMVITTYLMAVCFGTEPFSLRNIIVLSLVAAFAAVAITGEVHFMWVGFFLQLAGCFAQSAAGVLQGKIMGASGGPKADPITMVMLTAPVTVAALLPVNFFTWSDGILLQFRNTWDAVVLSCFLAFLLQVVNAVTIKELSATGLAVAAVVKDLVIVAAAIMVLGEGFTWIQVCGFAGSLTFISLYSAMKLFPAWFESWHFE